LPEIERKVKKQKISFINFPFSTIWAKPNCGKREIDESLYDEKGENSKQSIDHYGFWNYNRRTLYVAAS